MGSRLVHGDRVCNRLRPSIKRACPHQGDSGSGSSICRRAGTESITDRGKNWSTDMNTWVVVLIVVVVLALVLLALSVRVVKQYERGVVFRLGRVTGSREPGLRFLIPIVDVMHRVSLRIVT